MDKFIVEREGQIDFYNRILPRVNPELSIDDIIANNNDGVINGCLLEFKFPVVDLNAHLFQTIKLLSALRIKGNPIPANILIIDLSVGIAWVYHSEEYLAFIEKPYYGGASKNNTGFFGGAAVEVLRYEGDPKDTIRLIAILKESKFTKTHIDENCIVGWAESFYRRMPTARKEDFLGDETGKHKKLGEIRNPFVFSEYLIPYEGKSNIRFNYLMDKLNDFLLKKNLGAFYTPPEYVKKSLELVRQAISRVPKGNKYVIIDRCAGTGNLESYMTEEELSRTIVSTIEYYEYKVLQEMFGSKVLEVIPPIETADTFNAGLVKGADALSEQYIYNPIVQKYLDDPTVTIILFENPPYADTTSVEHQRRGLGKSSSVWKNSYVVKEMKKTVKGTAVNDLGNAFIWSGFRFYLRQPTDCYIVFSPVKYWKAQHLVKKQFLGGFAFNRRHFHTNIDACIMCALWSNIDDDLSEFDLIGYDIVDGKLQEHPFKLPVKRVFSSYSERYYDKRSFPDDAKDGILCEATGLERFSKNTNRCTPINNTNCLGYMVVYTSGFDNPDLHSYLLVGGKYDGNGFFLRNDNYLEKLPMFCASRYITYNRAWTERARIMKSADGDVSYRRDLSSGKLGQFLLKCLLFACLEMQNHMRSFKGSDERFYRNELCLDNTLGDTIATRDIKKLRLNDIEKELVKQWDVVLKYAKSTVPNERNNGGYNSTLTYGVYQIFAELDTSYTDDESGKTIWDNIELHTALNGLKELVKTYYNSEIVPTLFEYEFIK